MTDFFIKQEIRIDWSDIDAMGHINNLAILKYVQTARVNYIETIGFNYLHSDKKIGPILASTHCQFRKPLFYPGQVTAFSKVEYIKNTSFGIQHKIYNDKNELIAEAQDIMVLYDFITNRKVTISDEIRKKIELLENKKFFK